LTLKQREYVLAARGLGASPARILFLHLVPNALGPVFVTAVLGIAGAILVESSLSFLGIGVQPPTPSWGNILTDGKEGLGYAWWLTIFPGLAIFFTVLAYNVVGERLRQSAIGRGG
jgi:peptide/nickel transport system permease protein